MIRKLLRRFACVKAMEAATAALTKENEELKELVARQKAIIERPEGALPELMARAKARALDSLMQMAQTEMTRYPGLAAKIMAALEFYSGRMLADSAYPCKSAAKGRAA